MTVEEVLGSLRVHESRLIERDNHEEEQPLLTKASKMSKKIDRGQTSKGRGRFGQSSLKTMKLKRRRLTSQKLNAIIVKRWATLLMNVMVRKRTKGKMKK